MKGVEYKEIFVSDDVYDALKNTALEYMDTGDTLNDGIRKWIRDELGMDLKDPTIEDVIDLIPENNKEEAIYLYNKLKSVFGLKVELPDPKKFKKRRNVCLTLKKYKPRTVQSRVAIIYPRYYGILLRVFKPHYTKYGKGKERYVDFKIGSLPNRKSKAYKLKGEVKPLSEVEQEIMKTIENTYSQI